MHFVPVFAAMLFSGLMPPAGDAYDCWAKKKKGSADTRGRISSANSESHAVAQFKDRWPGYETYYCVKVNR